ncbi:MAG: 16S rRNA (guanine(527)-N(7))-methyltransferase RsmG [Clostridiales bacterium]|nr:16S rRNA (guanine(527)-N(7))-methyltransferase RsmG [Clostridiales bacterium]
MNNKQLLKDLSKKINIELTDDQINEFEKYQDLLLEWNEKINLTAITEENDIIIKHFVDSLTISKYFKDNDKIIDVGTGAGFPGIPLKIANKTLKVTLLDSLNKRIVYLNDVIEKIGLKDVETIHGRAEELSRNSKYREQYDVVTARAVANLKTLSEYCIPFVKLGGYFVCMKGSNIEEEMMAAKEHIKELGGNIEEILEFVLPETDMKRNIIIIKKIKNTDKKFPRKKIV